MERPSIKWRTVLTILGAFVVLWVTAAALWSYAPGTAFGYVVLGVVGAITLGAIGFGIYVLRLTRRSQGIVEILAQATDAEGRQRALEQLSAGDDKDAMKALARAQLVAREEPQEAIRILEAIDIPKAPAVVQDDVRSNLAFLYLLTNRARDARALADDIRFDRQPNAKAKAMYAAVTSEAFARTGKREAALDLIDTYDPDDPEFADVRTVILRAQVFVFAAAKKGGRAQQAMRKLGKADPNMVLQFLQKGIRPDLQKMATKTLKGLGMAPRPKMKVQRR